MAGRRDGRVKRLPAWVERDIMRTYQRCRTLVKRAKKVILQGELDVIRPPPKSEGGGQHQLFSVKEVARRLSIPPVRLREAWVYVSLVQQYPALAPPACGMNRALWIGRLLAHVPEAEREAQLAELLLLQLPALQVRYRKSLTPRRPRPEALKKPRGRKLQRISGAIWHERLVEIRQHMQQLGTRGLVELLAKTWKPEVQQMYMRELQQLIDELTMLHHRIDSVSQPPVEVPQEPDAKIIDIANHRRGG